ncbi:NAD(P)/FAD-dependent oxidoreductase [Qipengyuania nanhaisediminis]|uniref:NAD(P)/FAD-dependent oxidoreductase n=1 Tax=Qipengyuania nanhaisediminis TaxID=604088 RepID=UPI0038B38E40
MTKIVRREVLAMAAVGTLASACTSGGDNRPRRVAVIGAGIVGASIAYNLAKAGAEVTIFDRHDVATRASRGTFAWLNATWAKQPRAYHRLNQLGMAGWQELESALDIPVKWGGSLEWFASEERQELLASQIAEQVAWGAPARMVEGSELSELEPQVNFRGTAGRLFTQ